MYGAGKIVFFGIVTDSFYNIVINSGRTIRTPVHVFTIPKFCPGHLIGKAFINGSLVNFFSPPVKNAEFKTSQSFRFHGEIIIGAITIRGENIRSINALWLNSSDDDLVCIRAIIRRAAADRQGDCVDAHIRIGMRRIDKR
jgi:hypothetical protein